MGVPGELRWAGTQDGWSVEDADVVFDGNAEVWVAGVLCGSRSLACSLCVWAHGIFV